MNRLELDSKIREILDSDNSYFQPPETVKMKYPCIVYKRSNINLNQANDKLYNYRKSYELTVIDKNPDSDLVDKVLKAFPMVHFVRHFTYENLNHDIFMVYI